MSVVTSHQTSGSHKEDGQEGRQGWSLQALLINGLPTNVARVNLVMGCY